ncbi:uncharacterized protein RAG0_01578 [Rhynchosporium agropyri]|uniref:Uncharacterized protein n=1 Tax=Rhynchosporium agropyri TaxID=914238 RepID=A0A1E1JXB1_9HELO|nr:uncharacterized protein RAG0_01578 [Rhynchosporium agropyri]
MCAIQALRTSRLRSAKSQFLKSALRNLDLSSTPATSTTSSNSTAPKLNRTSTQSQSSTTQSQTLPPDLLELLLLLSFHLNSPAGMLTSQQLTLLLNTPTWTCLPCHLPKISDLISTHLYTHMLALCRILTPATNPSFLHRTIPKLLPTISSLQTSNLQQKAELAERRIKLATHTTTLLTLHHLATHLLIRILEQTSHGLLARHIKARSEYLALRAGQLATEVRGLKEKGERIVYSEEVKGALETYVGELRGGRERGRERRTQAERVLWGYGVGREDRGEKERVMREIAKVYGELVREVEEVGQDVERLRGR